jgi:hypothetical protein
MTTADPSMFSQATELDAAVLSSVTHLVGQELAARLVADPRRRESYFAGDRSVEDEAIAAACGSAGVDVDAYRRGIASDPALGQLQLETLRDSVVEPPDPGPYGAISRESASPVRPQR